MKLCWLRSRYFNPRGCISLDQQHPGYPLTHRYFNPRGCISLDWIMHFISVGFIFQSTRLYKPRRSDHRRGEYRQHFNPRGCISLDMITVPIIPKFIFQSTRLYKPRRRLTGNIWKHMDFNPRGCISLDTCQQVKTKLLLHFNPRGCISLDVMYTQHHPCWDAFQSTRLYKPRPTPSPLDPPAHFHFNPRGCISLDHLCRRQTSVSYHFNPRGCISLDGKYGNYGTPWRISIHEAV